MYKNAKILTLALIAAMHFSTGSVAQDAKSSEEVKSAAPKTTSAQKFRPEIPNAKYLIPGRSLLITSVDGTPPAVVGEEEISWEEYNLRLSKQAQSVFYHRTVPFGEEAELRTKVIKDLILERLKFEDAKKRGISFDEKWVDDQVNALDKQYRGNENWEKQREETLPKLRKNFERDSLLKNLEDEIRKVSPPNSEAVRKYYDENKEQFTEPARQKVSAILLGVDPSSHRSVWEKAKAEAEGILDKINNGGDFAEIASLRSTDPSAAEGGDLGYLHQGMLNSDAQEAIDKMDIGGVTEPIRLLQGYAIFKLVERIEPREVSYEKSFSRARQLLIRKISDENWKTYQEELAQSSDVKINPILEFEVKEEAKN